MDEGNLRHIRRHGVSQSEAGEVMRNGAAALDYDIVEGEERWTAIGHTNLLRVLVVAWTPRRDKIRVVTAWPAPKGMRRKYRIL